MPQKISKKECLKIAKYRIKNAPLKKLLNARKFIEDFGIYKKVKKSKSTYTVGVQKALNNTGTGRVYFKMKLDGTVTGRLSCAKYENLGISFHTLSRESVESGNIRKMFVALDKEDKRLKFITADYKGNELRLIAHFSRDKKMQKAFIEDRDLHTYTASLLFDKNEEDVTKEERQIAKSVSFLIMYGGGPLKLAGDFGISFAKAKGIINKYQLIFKDVFVYMDYVHTFIKENLYSYTVLGRKRHLENVKSRVSDVVHKTLRQGFNMIPQSLGSDLTLCAMVGLYNCLSEMKYKSKIVGNVHDSLEIGVTDDEMISVLQELYDQMVNHKYITDKFGVTFDIPLGVEIIIGKSFGDGIEVEFSPNGKVTNKEEINEYFNNI